MPMATGPEESHTHLRHRWVPNTLLAVWQAHSQAALPQFANRLNKELKGFLSGCSEVGEEDKPSAPNSGFFNPDPSSAGNG